MQKTPKHQHPAIHAEIAKLQHQKKQLNLKQKIELENRSKSEHAAFVVDQPGFVSREPHRIEELRLRQIRDAALSDRVSTERDIAALDREIERFNVYLSADNAAVETLRHIDAIASQIAEARAAVDAAMSAKDEITRMVDSELHTVDAARATAGGALLDQIKAGKPYKLHTINRDHLDTLRVAQTAAIAELNSALVKLAQLEADKDAATAAHAEALADISARALHLSAIDYARALHDCREAAYACGRHFDAPDVDQMSRLLNIDHAD
jgi:hypothetical protein